MIATTLKGALTRYTLYRTLAPETIAWYSRAVSVFCRWAGGDVPLSEFNGERISLMLLDKQRAGRSAFYIKSLRGGLVALLREIRGDEPVERVRSIRTPPLDPHALTAGEVERLLLAVDSLPEGSRWRYKVMILLGYYTGLDAADIWRIEKKHLARLPTGAARLAWRRGKTGGAIYVEIPPDAMQYIDAYCASRGPMVRMGVSKEWFRRVIASLYSRAGLCGTFKTLRKSAGSLVEQEKPGTGHKHLGNTRAIFERHYEAKKITRAEPTMPPKLRLPKAS